MQLLYAWELQGRPPFEQIVDSVLPVIGVSRPVAERACELAEGTVRHIHDRDATIAELVVHWRPERVASVERAILRLALEELDRGQTPPRVVIDEAVRLAQWFGGDSAPAFVNGVLDAAARSLGRL